ncbi:lipoprotein chaperone [Thalassovita autumnalis]|uniref:Lipoprotein chaperone n=1 Tax=Thalassovita autumnalis TaxID=2072972 RepID=A0A0P1FW12_9RHOB|nr:outer membrane lipoprotein carrier protein LolA [Thalassovita autumnalis]CUH69899.1 lipoprotein chaperone [Thalassovita autumnalis]CUH73286.1 lipoprotein chaperone [Thalassovita autumnalis]|tara:strand:- start:238 stop:840 length:603 start_codon:yes stop_codon:yes gene_type:complete
MKTLRYTVAALTALSLSALPALAEKISLNQLSAYLNDLKTAQADFTQISDDGTIMTGQLMLKRPWKIRFEYDQDKTLVLAEARTVAIFDPRGNPQPETYPLGKTPLKLILDRNINLGRANMVVGHSYDGTATTVVAQDPEHPEYGTLSLVFTDNPVQLRQWIVRDDAGSATTVVLGALDSSVKLSNQIFDIGVEKERRSR